MKTQRYIYKVKNSYQIRKQVDGNLEHFGTFKNYDDAVMECELYEFCGWDWDVIQELNSMEEVETVEFTARMLSKSYSMLRIGDIVTVCDSKKPYDAVTRRFTSKKLRTVKLKGQLIGSEERNGFTYTQYKVSGFVGE